MKEIHMCHTIYLTPMFFIRFCTLLPNHPLLNTILTMSVLQSNTYSHFLLPISVLNAWMSGCFRQGDGEDNLFHDKRKYLDFKLGINGTQGLSSPTKDLKFGHFLPYSYFLTSLANLGASLSQIHKLKLKPLYSCQETRKEGYWCC